MLIFDNERALMRDEVIGSSGQLTPAIRKLQELSKNAVDLQQMGHRTDARVRLGSAGFFTNVAPATTQAVIDGTISMFDIAHDPDMWRMLESEIDETEEDLLSRLLPASVIALMRLTRRQQGVLEDIQFAESSSRFKEGSLHRAYLKATGNEEFEGLFYAWGLVDHNATNFDIDHQAGRVMSLVRTTTRLPHLRFEIEYNSNFDGGWATIKQSLTVNPRVAFLTEGVDEWYKRLIHNLPAQ